MEGLVLAPSFMKLNWNLGNCPCKEESCSSDDAWAPVCGDDGITYLNAERVINNHICNKVHYFIFQAKCNKHPDSNSGVKSECQQACPCLTEITDDPNTIGNRNKEYKSGNALDTLQVKKSDVRDLE